MRFVSNEHIKDTIYLFLYWNQFSKLFDKFINFYDKENNLVDQNTILKNSKYIIISSASDYDYEKILKVFESNYFGFLSKKVLLLKAN